MPKDSFQFKQFTIYQTGSTLKVCTDSCLFGAWVASQSGEAKRVLDIGTGTGLLVLMYVQKQPSSDVTALEINEESAKLASENIANSPWRDRIKVKQTAVQEFGPEERFDCIISNPPFFENQLISEKDKNNLAKHAEGLTREALLEALLRLLSKEGITYLLFPEREGGLFSEMADKRGFYLNEEVKVRNKKEGPVFRVMQKYSFKRKETITSEIIIYEAHQVYTASFISLLKEFYLYL